MQYAMCDNQYHIIAVFEWDGKSPFYVDNNHYLMACEECVVSDKYYVAYHDETLRVKGEK